MRETVSKEGWENGLFGNPSENILQAVEAAKKKQATVITLSGFKSVNPLKKLGQINFYVPSSKYGFVETIHTSICHCLVDVIADKKNGQIQNR